MKGFKLRSEQAAFVFQPANKSLFHFKPVYAYISVLRQ